MNDKETFILQVWDDENPSIKGTGEIALFRGLSEEDSENFDKIIETCLQSFLKDEKTTDFPSSVIFGLESAIASLNHGGRWIVFPSDFTNGTGTIVINGLIWMGDHAKMLERIERKISEGFTCLKLKIGGISFAEELSLIGEIRKRWSGKDLTIRLDANGSFSRYTFEETLSMLNLIARYDIHSIEQPFAKGERKKTRRLCEECILPIALDEELIGVNDNESKQQILDEIQPQYIILKPSLCGGFNHADEWIAVARERNVGWWITSALESAIGLNAITQWTATKNVEIPQGLGTGELYKNDFHSPIARHGERLFFVPEKHWELHDNLSWIYV